MNHFFEVDVGLTAVRHVQVLARPIPGILTLALFCEPTKSGIQNSTANDISQITSTYDIDLCRKRSNWKYVGNRPPIIEAHKPAVLAINTLATIEDKLAGRPTFVPLPGILDDLFSLQLAPQMVSITLENFSPDSTSCAIFGNTAKIAHLRSMRDLSFLWCSTINSKQLPALINSLPFRLETLALLSVRSGDPPCCQLPETLSTLLLLDCSRLSPRIILENNRIRRLLLQDCFLMKSISWISEVTDLEVLFLAGHFSKPMKIATLSPLLELRSLKAVAFTRILASDLSIVADKLRDRGVVVSA